MAAQEQEPLLGEKDAWSESTRVEEDVIEHVKRRLERWRDGSYRQRGWTGHRRGLAPWLLLSAVCGVILLTTYTIQANTITCHKPIPPPTGGDAKIPVNVSNYTCIPGQLCWPSTAQWSAFNRSVNGNLKIAVPWATPCYNSLGNASDDQCRGVADKYMDGFSRSAQYASMEFLNWETCGQSSCSLNSFAPGPAYGECSLGRLSTYYVEAHTAHDISTTLDFVRDHGIRVSIKNSGHDYFGRSNAANSLAIWTHNMKDAKYHKTLKPQGCTTRYENVGDIGAGVQAKEAWEFFEPLGMLVTVGAVGSVGIAGGFGQGGGHGPLGPTWGLMVDNAIEFDVVTADGQFRTINESSDPDLFWAMRGGGGGTYAVLVSYRFQLHPAVPLNVYSFQAKWPMPKDITESNVHRDIVRALAQNQTLFAENGIAGYNFLLPDHIVSLQILPSSDTQALEAITSQWHDFLSSYPGLNITDNSYHVFSKFSEWYDFTQQPSIARNGPVGVGIAESGRFLPKKLFASNETIEQVVEAVVTAMQFSKTNRGGGSAQLYATGPSNHPDNSKTGVHPAWRDAVWEVIVGGFWKSTDPVKVQNQIQNTISASIQPFKALTPEGGCYMNEGDWTEENWQQTFFGSNYPKLLQVKKTYDPTGLFNCWKCVGWTGYDDPMYSCYAQSKSVPNPTIPLGPVG